MINGLGLDTIYKAYLNIQNEKPESFPGLKKERPDGRVYYDEKGNTFNPKSRFFSYLVAAREFGGFPTILTDGKFQGVKKKQIYHGFHEFDHGDGLLLDFNYHQGVFGAQGTFFTELKDEAATYTWVLDEVDGCVKPNRDKIMRAKIVSDNSCTREDMMGIRQSFDKAGVDAIENPEDREKISELYDFCFNQTTPNVFDKEADEINRYNFFKAILNHDYTLAVFLGYDYMICYDWDRNYNHYVLFNRAKMIVPESDMKRFCENSQGYQGAEIILE